MPNELPVLGQETGTAVACRSETARHLAVLLRALSDWQALQVRRAERLTSGAQALEAAALRRLRGDDR